MSPATKRSSLPAGAHSGHPRRRRTGALAVAGVATAALALSACSGASGDGASDAGSVDSIRVVDYYTNEPDTTIYQAVLDACAAEEGVTIEREAIPGPNLISKALQMISSQTLPDILMVDNPDLQQIAETGALVPLSELGVSVEGQIQATIDAATYEGEVFAVQPITNTIVLFYNVDAFDAAGVEPPTTWDELKSVAAELTTGDQYGIAFSAPATYEGSWQFLPFLWNSGGSETDLTSPEAISALQLLQDLVQSGSASESVVNWQQSDVNDQFMAGQAAMMVNGPWNMPLLDENSDVNYDIAQIPAPTADGQLFAPLGGEVWTAPRTGDEARQQVAGKILACINSDENQLELASARQTVPTKIALQDEFVAENPAMEVFSEMVLNGRSRTGLLGTEWPEVATQIYNAMQLALVGGKTPAEAMEQSVNG